VWLKKLELGGNSGHERKAAMADAIMSQLKKTKSNN
jgi:hypothetical protein